MKHLHPNLLPIMSLIKDIYNEAFFVQLSTVLRQTLPLFQEDLFMQKIYEDRFLDKEWKDRMIHVADVLHQFMPPRFDQAGLELIKIVDQLQNSPKQGETLAYIFLAEYIARYGIDDLQTAIPALERTTQFISCEFAVRPFILKYPDQMLAQLTLWSKHPNHKVRRFSSEGSRPKLPWSMVLPQVQKNPNLTIPILENLMLDEHPWVRKSVANHLNDISKDHPKTALDLAQKWKGISKETDSLIKHGMRTLLKKGHRETLALYGLDHSGMVWTNFKINSPTVAIGGALHFSFEIENQNTTEKMIRLEYGLYYQKANGQLNKKVFKISERHFEPLQKNTIDRKQSFKIITTRKFHVGLHQLSLIVNGFESEKLDFTLTS